MDFPRIAQKVRKVIESGTEMLKNMEDAGVVPAAKEFLESFKKVIGGEKGEKKD